MQKSNISFCQKQSVLGMLFLCMGLMFSAGSCAWIRTWESHGKAAITTSASQEVSTVRFFNSEIFDRNMSSLLKSKLPALTVEFPAPLDLSSIPERLDKWLFVVQKNKGALSLKTEESEGYHGLIDDAIGLVMKTYNYLEQEHTYSPITDYDATVYYKKKTGLIHKVVFSQKSPN